MGPFLPGPEPEPTPVGDSLRSLFHGLVTRTFRDTVGLTESGVNAYLGDMLARFAHRDNLYRVRSLQGRALEEVAEMLMEADPTAEGGSFDRERAVHRHIGDFTLFWAGLYPEALRRMREQGRADSLIDYVRQGKHSYYVVSTFRHGPFAEDAPLFQQLSEGFELCLYGLSLVRRDWERLSAGRPLS